MVEILYMLFNATCNSVCLAYLFYEICFYRCAVCNNDSTTPCPDGSQYSDSLQEFDPLDVSNTSSQLSGKSQKLKRRNLPRSKIDVPASNLSTVLKLFHQIIR